MRPVLWRLVELVGGLSVPVGLGVLPFVVDALSWDLAGYAGIPTLRPLSPVPGLLSLATLVVAASAAAHAVSRRRWLLAPLGVGIAEILGEVVGFALAGPTYPSPWPLIVFIDGPPAAVALSTPLFFAKSLRYFGALGALSVLVGVAAWRVSRLPSEPANTAAD